MFSASCAASSFPANELFIVSVALLESRFEKTLLLNGRFDFLRSSLLALSFHCINWAGGVHIKTQVVHTLGGLRQFQVFKQINTKLNFKYSNCYREPTDSRDRVFT